MSASRKQAKPARRQRFARWLERPSNRIGGWGILEIQVGRQTTTYRVRRLATDFGVGGFEIVKLAAGMVNTGLVYHVLLDGRKSKCDCIGCEQHGHCKHIEALQALLAAEKDQPAVMPDPRERPK